MAHTRSGTRRRRRSLLIAGGVALVVVVVIAAVIVLVRRTAAPPAGSVDVPDDQPVEVVFGLARDQTGLERSATQGEPALSLADIASRFGASSDSRERLAARLGASSLEFSATGGLARWRTTLGAASAQGIHWDVSSVAGQRVLVPAGGAAVPSDLRGTVTEVLALPSALPGGAETSSSAAPADPAGLTSAPGCAQARETGENVVSAQGLDVVHAAGHTGAGARVSLIEVTRFDQAAFDAWLDCIGHGPVQVRRIPAVGAGPVAGSAEAQTDLAAITLALPALGTVTLVGSSDADWVGDPLETALTDPAGLPQVISTSIVYCERTVSAAERDLAEYVLAAAVAAGVMVVAATGDRGSTACAPGDASPAVAYPASSPFVLAVGGSNGAREVWRNTQERSAGGGGTSQVFPGRRLPDLAMLASAPDLPPMPVCPADCEWRSYGGTSFAAPFVAGGLLAVAEARSSAGLAPLRLGTGTADRALDPGWFDDVTQGSNDVAGVGCCAAAAGFDLASGWGVPKFDVLARSTTS